MQRTIIGLLLFSIALMVLLIWRGPLSNNAPNPQLSQQFDSNPIDQNRWGSQPPTESNIIWHDPAFNITFVHVPAGEFVMGSADGKSDAQPAHTVDLDAFWIMQTEVTNAHYQRCVADSACTPPWNEQWQQTDRAAYPVSHVTWDQARAFAAWVGGRLPTEAEWEKAARGSDERPYPWGDDPPTVDLLNYERNVDEKQPVGSYPAGASPYGAFDMAGNVWEWVADWYAVDIYTASPRQNPRGPESGGFHVLRGGSWRTTAETARSYHRFREPPYGEVADVGIRVVR